MTSERVKELAERRYDGHDDSIDLVPPFISNEQVYRFAPEHNRSLLDDALAQKIVLCSPTTFVRRVGGDPANVRQLPAGAAVE